MRAQSDTGPIGGLPRVRERLAIRYQRRNELIHQMWMGSSVAGALCEAEVRFLTQVIDPPGGEALDRLRQTVGVIRRLDGLRYLRLGQFGRVQNQRLVL